MNRVLPKRLGLALLCLAFAAVGGPGFGAAADGSAPDRADPLFQSRGDHPRSYNFAAAGETSPYRVYVPEAWGKDKPKAMVVILHGGGGNQDGPFNGEPAGLKGILKAEADKHGFILLSPYGYLGQWGSDLPPPPPPSGVAPPGSNLPPATPGSRTRPSSTDHGPAANQIRALGEQDVMNVVRRTAAEYGVDPARIYLMGNSGGSIGTMFLAEKHPEVWAAIAPSNGPIDSSSFPFDRLKSGRLSGAFVIHGELDTLTSEPLMRLQSERIKALGVDTRYQDVAGANHGSAFYMVLPQVFDYFAAHPAKAARR